MSNQVGTLLDLASERQLRMWERELLKLLRILLLEQFLAVSASCRASQAIDFKPDTTFMYLRNKKIARRKEKLDIDPQRDNNASPISSHRCMLRPT